LFSSKSLARISKNPLFAWSERVRPKSNCLSDRGECISLWDSYYVAPNTSSRPLQRTSSPQRWVRNPETGELRALLQGDSWSPIIQAASGSSRSDEADEDAVFEREYQAAMRNRDYMADLTRKLIALDQLNEDMRNLSGPKEPNS